MDKLISAGKDFLESQAQGQNQNQGQGQSNRPDGSRPQGDGSQHGSGDKDGFGNAHQQASQLAGSSGSSELFSKIAGAIGQRKGQIANEDVDEEDAARKHKQAYQDDSRGDENSVGAAAAMQAIKMFSQGGGGGGGGGGGQQQGQSTILAMAMSEASKLFDSKAAAGKLPEGASKESAVQKAGEMAMKMYFKNQAQQKGGLAGMASKFIN